MFLHSRAATERGPSAFRSLLSCALICAIATSSFADAPAANPNEVVFHKSDVTVPDVKTSVWEIFNGAPTQPITLEEAIEMALHNNLEARFERLGISVQKAELKFAAG